MPGYRHVADNDGCTVYQYDGSLKGLYCCVYAAVYGKEMPFAIHTPGEGQCGLFPQKAIATDHATAQRVRAAVKRQLGQTALELAENVYYSYLDEKEMHILRFLLLGFEKGPIVCNMLSHEAVAPLIKAERHLKHEAHLLTGFVRFSDYDGMLAAVITPKNFVLPFITSHFCERYSQERFLIYDKTHGAALLYERGQPQIVSLSGLQLNEPPPEELQYRALWKRFYDTIAIEGRINPKCRMGHMPKRYWENMTELQ